MYREADALLLSKDKPPIKELLKIDGRVIELDTQIIDNSSLSVDDNDNKINGDTEKDSEHLRVKKKRNVIIILLIVSLILLLAAGIILSGNNILIFSDLWVRPGKLSCVSESSFLKALVITALT